MGNSEESKSAREILAIELSDLQRIVFWTLDVFNKYLNSYTNLMEIWKM